MVFILFFFRIHLEMDPTHAALVIALRPLLESIINDVVTSPSYIYEMPEEEKEVIRVIERLCEFNAGRYNLPHYIL